MAEISSAASDGCLFFSRLWYEIRRSGTPDEQLLRTQIQLEFSTGKTAGHEVAENSHSLAVIVSTKYYSWTAAHFDLVSSYDDPSANNAIARCIVGDVSAPCSLDQIQRRLARCRLHHSRCRPRALSGDEPRILPLRFLNVDPIGSDARVTLVQADHARFEHYITLSYVWGQDQTIKTTQEALARYSESGIEIDTLPKTIRDAIKVTRHLGVNLLWVDSLCIVQDDADELGREMANMSSYYGNSLITISASAAKSAAEGFLHPSDKVYGDRQEGTYELPFRFNDTARGYIRLLPPRTPCSEAIDSRAWTLQEGLTSSRLVSFGRDTISWSCLSENHGEVKLGRLRPLFREAKIQRLGSWDATCRASFSAAVCYLDTWNDIVCEYCDRRLSDAGDGLVAISGIAYEFSAALQPSGEVPSTDRCTSTYLAGLWRSACLPLQLLWRPQESRRYPTRHVYVAPSWSWAAARAPLQRYGTGAYFRWLLESWRRPGTPEPFTVESCNLELSNVSAPYGALRSGYLIVRGRTCTTDASSLHEGKLAGIQISLDVGGHSTDPDFLSRFSQNLRDITSLTLLEVSPKAFKDKNGDIFPTGLVLSENEDGSYLRLGLLFYTESTRITWETATLKLV